MAVTAAFDLTPRQLDTVRALLARCLPGTGAWVYGSRARWTSRPDSDLDLVVFAEPGQARAVSDLREAFEESDLPFRVDLFVWDEVPDAFRQEIKREHVVLLGGHSVLERSGSVDPVRRSPDETWRHMAFTEAVVVNPAVRLERGLTYPFVDMAAVTAGFRCAHAMDHRTYSGGGSRFQDGDTLMARITPCLENGKIARYCADRSSESAHGSTEFIVVRGRDGVTDSGYAYYLTQWRELRSYAVDQMTGTSGRQRVPVNSLSHVSVPVPPLPEQRAIARVLGALDDKIELNRRMNETLEATARAIFRDWFVDFGPVRAKMEGREPYLPPGIWGMFPDALDDAGKPKGWTMGTLSDIARSPRRTISPADVFRHTPYIGLEHMPRRSIALTQWESAVKVTSDKLAFRAGEILFGKLRPYFHKVGVAPVEGICSTDIVVVVSQAPQLSAFTAVCLSSDGFVDYTDRTSTGTRMPRTSWRTMGQYRICLPSEDVAGAFQGLAQPLIDCIGANIHEASFLAQFRDLLIPKLISGQIRLRTDETSAGMDSANNRRVTAPSHDRRKPHPGRGRDVSGDGKAPCGP